CSLDQAKVIVSCRPFYNAEDMKKKLRKKKGVSSAVLDQYREMIKGYYEVDRVLTQCEKHGLKLSTIMNIWAGLDPADPSSSSTDDGAVELVEISKSTIQNDHQEAFKNYIHQQPSSIPPGITLKSYQLLGINWLNLLYSKRISCILADEMGLGKTAQVVCFLAHLKSKNNPGPHLVIVPSSTLENWKREFATFSPNLLVRSYYGSQTERAELRYELKSTSDLDVVITTYNIATGAADDRKFLDKMRFETCIYDEGHQLKNSESKRYKDLMRQKVGWRLLLTGTPLQNNLQELVSLLSFILPEIFQHAKDDLRTIFKVPSEAQANLLAQTRIMRAKKMMKPFVLRRKKQQVLKDLPKKIEQVVYCPMEQRQAEIYNEVMKRSKKHWMAMRDGLEPDGDDDLKEMENGLLGKNLKKKKKTGLKKSVLMTTCNVLMELRKAAIHPMLFRNLYDDQTIEKMSKACLNELAFCDRDAGLILEDMEVMTDFELHRFTSQYKHLKQFSLSEDECMLSGKVKVLEKLLKEIKDRGSRVLIFSQFTQVLSILERVMERFFVKFLILTGSTQVGERQGLVDQFTQDLSITAFLLSTKAGGLGLNLMAADTVIIFDQDFNPQNDRQAEDRAYRLGQKRDVRVIKLISEKTIEEDIFKLACTKIAIDRSISSTNQLEEKEVLKTSLKANTQLNKESEIEIVKENGNVDENEIVVQKKLIDSLRKRFLEGE
ncbi:hypothetical protein O181_078759, partial [Austropuccinia psidii MF-1]|nr:hypothetical protein [Austropuccinia psidii MF-1]